MRQRARATGQNFVDASMAQRFPAGLPQQLRPKAGHLTPAQMRVYEDFARVPHPAGPGPAGALGRPGDAQVCLKPPVQISCLNRCLIWYGVPACASFGVLTCAQAFGKHDQ